MKNIKLRPHHFLCILNFRGKGYNDAFVDNFYSVIEQLECCDSEQVIEVVWHNDDICCCCPNSIDSLNCDKDVCVKPIDKRHMDVLNLPEKLTWVDAKKIIAEKVTLENFNWMCEGCPWKEEICDKLFLGLDFNCPG